jgi:transcriptional regulator with XRE-family HTH domain
MESQSTGKLSVGALLRGWRTRRRLSQFDLAGEVDISTRHLSFLETGRSLPSREMVLRLAEHLDVPLRERNVLLVAAGLAPEFPERPLDDPALRAARQAVELVLQGHEPYPALALDRYWNVMAANRAVGLLLTGVDEVLLQPPLNVMRLSLHPRGLASQIVNFREWHSHCLERLRRQIDLSADPKLVELMDEVKRYPIEHVSPELSGAKRDYTGIVIPLELRSSQGVLSFLSTTTVFGTAIDITLAELVLELFFPANASTSETMRQRVAALD